jgi:hypothetical protein
MNKSKGRKINKNTPSVSFYSAYKFLAFVSEYKGVA